MKYLKRILIYITGYFLIAMGVVLSIRSNLGTAPVSTLTCILSKVSGISLGIVTALMYIVLTSAQIAVLRKDFKKKDLLQIVFSFIFGTFVEISERIVFFGTPESFILRLSLTLLSIVFIASGLTLYLSADIVLMSPEGFMNMIAMKTGKPFPSVKTAYDISSVAITAAISLAVYGKVFYVSIGTVISALLTGYCMKFFTKLLKSKIDKFLE